MADNITALTDATFDEDIKTSEQPVLVDFWAEWCGPCRTIAPSLEEIANEKDGALRIAKLNVDENPDVTRRFEVQSIPTLILFKDGAPTDLRIIGAKSKQQLLQDVTPYLDEVSTAK
jgi:thioredoxin 1